MPSASKRKGTGFEREVVNILNDVGIPAKRVPLSGAMTDWKGDVLIQVQHEWLQGECKRRKSGFKTLYGWLQGNHMLIVRDDHCEPLVVLPLESFASIVIKGEK